MASDSDESYPTLTMQLSLTTAACAALLALSSVVAAQPAAPEKSPDSVGLDESYVAAVNRRALGVGLGLDQGYWGTGFGQALRIDVPFHRHFGMRARGILAHGPIEVDHDWDPALFGALEIYGRGPVMLGLARMYGGGGIHIGGRPNPQDDQGSFGIGGGGHLGIEMFLNPGYSFSVEIGGQAPVHELAYDAGASVMGGMTVYIGG